MVLYVLIGSLAAFGLLCAVWAVLGLWLSEGRGWAAVCFSGAALRRCRWLRAWGFLKGPVIAVDMQIPHREKQRMIREYSGIEFCSLEALAARLEQERSDVVPTGNRDHSGNHRRGGISEL